jgi:hypothetical protein
MLVRDYYPHSYGSALLGNDFVVDSMLFVRYLDVCRGEELQKFHRYLKIQQEIEDSKPHQLWPPCSSGPSRATRKPVSDSPRTSHRGGPALRASSCAAECGLDSGTGACR